MTLMILPIASWMAMISGATVAPTRAAKTAVTTATPEGPRNGGKKNCLAACSVGGASCSLALASPMLESACCATTARSKIGNYTMFPGNLGATAKVERNQEIKNLTDLPVQASIFFSRSAKKRQFVYPIDQKTIILSYSLEREANLSLKLNFSS